MTRSRSIFDSTKDAYKKKYGNKGTGIVITQSFLFLLSAALSTTNSIQFGVLVNELAPGASTTNSIEQRLSIVDNFLITEMKVALMKVASGDYAGQSELFTFPNSLTFSKSGEAKNLQEVFNGKLNLTINGEVILDSWDLSRHYRVGVAQKGLAASSNATVNTYLANEFDSASYGFYPMTPQVELRGNAKNVFRITLPDSVDLSGTSSNNYVAIVLRGLLIQNGSSIAQG